MLHAKVYGIDRRVVFVGSFNFDPRSRLLNTEMGLLLDIPVLAERLAAGFDAITAEHAWRLERVPAAESRPAHIEWVATEDGRERRLADEPAAEFWRRLRAMLMSLLPLDELL
jgi:putative cardiolipin synthase